MSRFTQFLEDLTPSKNTQFDKNHISGLPVNIALPHKLVRQLGDFADEYNQELEEVASALLSIALTEVIENMPADKKAHMYDQSAYRDKKELEQIEERCWFDAGGT